LQKSRIYPFLLVLISFVPVSVRAQSVTVVDKINGAPSFSTESGVTTVPASSKTVPHWTSSFTYSGVTYPYTMVGTNPSTNSTTTVDVVLIPIQFVFADGLALDATQKVTNVLNSPNFADHSYTSGLTQFTDAVQRAEFWPAVSTSSVNWHTLIQSTGNPYQTQVVNVPQSQAFLFRLGSNGPIFALMNISWFTDRLHEIINAMHISPTTLPIILTYDTFMYDHPSGSCCVLGYHGAFSSVNGNGNQQIQTFAFAAWTDAGIFPPGWADVLPLSHEISEWANDPFVHNFVPPWQFPEVPGSCQANLETGDPLEVLPHPDYPVTINGYTYRPQTEAILPWFSRQVPSTAISGAYSYPDTTKLTGPSQPCS
jgi:hypothetical protein